VFEVGRFSIVCGLLASVAALQAQAPPAIAELERVSYVRRFSVGATAAFPITNSIKTGSALFYRSTPALVASYEGSSKFHWGSGGLMLQVALTDRIALNANALFRKSEFTTKETDLIGTDLPSTLIDDRTVQMYERWTRMRLLDVPVLVRFFDRSRYRRGARWFFEAGANMRNVSAIKTRIISTDNGGAQTYSTSPNPSYRRTTPGAVLGMGFQLIDPVGVRVIPEVRYTRWLGVTVDVPAAHSARDQFEALFSLAW
jgi:hypothetical protein